MHLNLTHNALTIKNSNNSKNYYAVPTNSTKFDSKDSKKTPNPEKSQNTKKKHKIYSAPAY
jgi:hypothetical protein